MKIILTFLKTESDTKLDLKTRNQNCPHTFRIPPLVSSHTTGINPPPPYTPGVRSHKSQYYNICKNGFTQHYLEHSSGDFPCFFSLIFPSGFRLSIADKRPLLPSSSRFSTANLFVELLLQFS